jgi:hypothetical protein
LAANLGRKSYCKHSVVSISIQRYWKEGKMINWFKDMFVGLPIRLYIALGLLVVAIVFLVLMVATGAVVFLILSGLSLVANSIFQDRWKKGRYLFDLPRDNELYELY